MTDRPNIEALAQEAKDLCEQYASDMASERFLTGCGTFDKFRATVDALAAQAAAVPQGWRLMPEEATDEMMDAFMAGDIRLRYRAMLSAAPPAPAPVERHFCPLEHGGEHCHVCEPASSAPVAMPEEPELPDDGELECWLREATELRHDQTYQSQRMRAAHSLENAYLLGLKLREFHAQRQAQVDALTQEMDERSAKFGREWAAISLELAALRSAPTGVQPLTEDARDAARYRWLTGCKNVPWGRFLDEFRLVAEGIDAAIDEARGITGTPAADGETQS